ncbi:hypothetical protein [Corynebacterium pollutisoli]|uniref:hypothetical protein n=1 Tax=Corynebacterium pollutisoli TaxID=1610489 RepID=UPI001F087B26|nr:hypothetical protein [Corynebacterium pollutisoli]
MADLLFHRAIKLTFVPNQFCNLGCTYCYLGDLTNNRDDPADVVAEFSRICDHLAHQSILIDQLLLHGAEISTLPEPVLRELFAFYTAYRRTHRLELKALARGGRRSTSRRISTTSTSCVRCSRSTRCPSRVASTCRSRCTRNSG